LVPQGGVGRGIRIVNSNDSNNNNELVRNNSDELHHNDDPNNDSLNVADANGDGDGGDEARIRSLPYKKHEPYMCPKCMTVFATSQNCLYITSMPQILYDNHNQ
ncbi:hypothetical protein PIB30_097785, partial [Stylosanthes scabra]|nr:hypothetical protein [Stylosanthes scabra]